MKPKQLPADLDRRITAMLASRAVRRCCDKMVREITYRDACTFWGLGEHVTGARVDKVLAGVASTIIAAENYLDADGVVVLADGRAVTAGDLSRLATLHDRLVQTFATRLDRARGLWFPTLAR